MAGERKIGERFTRVSMLHMDYDQRHVGARVQRRVVVDERGGSVLEGDDMVWFPWDEFVRLTGLGNADRLVEHFNAAKAAHEAKMKAAAGKPTDAQKK